MMQYKYWICLLKFNIYINIRLLIKCTELPELIYELCPYTDMCNRTASRSLNRTDRVPCCSSCHCDEDCGLHLNCCFDHLDKYKLVERGMVDCIDPKVRNENKNYFTQKGYFMVKACGVWNLNISNEDINLCPVIDENGSSLISPVSSLETNHIYINEYCAACNEVNMTHGKQWNYIIESKTRPNLESTVTEIQNYLGTEFGTKTFIPPLGENWSHKHCYINYKEADICIENNERWEYMCLNLRATFLTNPIPSVETSFRNVFCTLCTGMPIQLIAKECDTSETKIGLNQEMTILLNTTVIKESRLFRRDRTTSLSKFSCPIGYVESSRETCLLVNCPEGMLMTENGCTYFALKWYEVFLSMQVKLLPKKGTKLSVYSLPRHGTLERSNPLSWLEVPCREAGFSEIIVYYSTTDQIVSHTTSYNATENYITSFVVVISQLVTESIDPSVRIPLSHKCVTENWIAKLGNKTYIFDAYFDKYIGYIQDGHQKLNKWPGKEMEVSSRRALYTPLIPDSVVPTGHMMLKKPFFCQNVRVPKYEVDVKFGEILIISKNISLGTNEYIVNRPSVAGDHNAPIWNTTTFSVCIDDYDPSYNEPSRGLKTTIYSSVSILYIFFSKL